MKFLLFLFFTATAFAVDFPAAYTFNTVDAGGSYLLRFLIVFDSGETVEVPAYVENTVTLTGAGTVQLVDDSGTYAPQTLTLSAATLPAVGTVFNAVEIIESQVWPAPAVEPPPSAADDTWIKRVAGIMLAVIVCRQFDVAEK